MPVVRISEELFKEIQKYAEPLVDNFETALWKALRSARKDTVVIPAEQKLHTRGNLTPQRAFWKPILEAIVEEGEQASAQKVVEVVERKMKNQLKLEDLALNRDGTTKWIKAVHYQRLAMVHEGLLASDSPRGIWSTTDKGRQWLSENDIMER